MNMENPPGATYEFLKQGHYNLKDNHDRREDNNILVMVELLSADTHQLKRVEMT